MDTTKSKFYTGDILSGFDKSDLLRWALAKEEDNPSVKLGIDGETVEVFRKDIIGFSVAMVIVVVKVDGNTTIRLEANDDTGNGVSGAVIKLAWQ